MKTIQILLVEDHPLAQKMAEAILKSLNCQIDIANDGQSALEKAKSKTYDLVLMDVGLPDIDGHEVTVKIREHEKGTRHTPIVALTAHANEEEKAKAMAAGMDDFQVKPLTPEGAEKILSKYVK